MQPLLKCVWMTAGVLNYRLCDRAYDCDSCLVDRAMRQGPADVPDAREASLGTAAPDVVAAAGHRPAEILGFAFRRSAFHSPFHFWVGVEAGGAVRIGLDEIARRLLGRLDRIGMPRPGTVLSEDGAAWSFDGEAGSFEMASPVSGLLLSRNEALLAHPRLLLRANPRDAWLARVRPRRLRSDLARLLYGRRARSWWEGEIGRLRDHMLAARAAGASVLPDGGDLVPSVLDRIEPSLRRTLVEDLLMPRDRHQKGR